MNRDPVRVLVTAVGGDLGQALIKALRISEAHFEIYGCDADSSGVGAAFVSRFEVVPAASDSIAYVSAIDELCRRLGIDAVVPASEAEILALAQTGAPLPCGAVVVCQPWTWLQEFGDKLTCMQALQGHLSLAAFADGSDRKGCARLVDRVGFPVVVKPRRSSGSRGVRLIQGNDELGKHLADTPASVVQQFIEDSEGEFSVGLFACDQFTEALAFRRELRGVGCSWFAETSGDEAVLEYALQFAKISKLRGSANVQVRKSSGLVQLLEVNPRFSSLVAARALCGFRDAEWSIQMALGSSPSAPPGSYRRLRFRRFFHELVDEGDGYYSVAEWAPGAVKPAGEAKNL
jgi:carbamoyl-phosphate synthase large subunit